MATAEEKILQQAVDLMGSTTFELEKFFERWDADGLDSNFLKLMATVSPEERAKAMLSCRDEAVRTGQLAAYEFLRFHVDLVTSIVAQMEEGHTFFRHLRDRE